MKTSTNGKKLAGRIALVTGGSRGLGRAICLRLGQEGAKVAIHFNRRREDAESVREEIEQAGAKAVILQADLAIEASCKKLISDVEEAVGGVDILVSNAGIFTDAGVEELTAAQWDETIAINLSAPFHCARACIPAMRARRWGRIITISSQAAFAGSPQHAHYAAAKAGLTGFTYSLARELGASGITANLISPGRIETEMLERHIAKRRDEWLAITPLGRFGLAEEIAGPVAFLASDDASYITGANLHVNGGILMG